MSAAASAAYAVALARLPGCGQQRLRALLALGDPRSVWSEVCAGRVPDLDADLARRWRESSRGIDPAEEWADLEREGANVWIWGHADYPPALADDPEAPPLLFWRGDSSALTRPAAAVVGTRRCTSYGADVARQFGHDLAAAGVAVVSGLALGIDGAAHEGALAGAGAPPVAVVGSGLDVVYPLRHRTLWRRVAEAGLLLSEAPLGAAPEAWRFPMRNRIIAALAGVVVVVESHASGGSMSTVRAASDRGKPILAVPGSVRSPSSVGTNRLLADGATPAVDAGDVLVALSLEGAHVGSYPQPQGEGLPESHLQGETLAVLRAVDWAPTPTEDVLRRTGLELGAASATLTRLEMHGLVRRRAGWWERVATRP